MKMTQEHQKELKAILEQVKERVLWIDLINDYETGDFLQSDRVYDLQKRFCFDLLSLHKRFFGASRVNKFYDNAYKYLNNDHIYTALKSMLPKIEKKY